MTDFKVNQRVRVVNSDRFNGLATVQKVLPKNVDVLMDDGRRVRVHPSFLSADLDVPALRPFTEEPRIPVAGTVVAASSDGDPRFKGLYVVVGDGYRRGTPVAKLVRLGGDDGSVWTVPATWFEVVPVSTLAGAL